MSDLDLTYVEHKDPPLVVEEGDAIDMQYAVFFSFYWRGLLVLEVVRYRLGVKNYFDDNEQEDAEVEDDSEPAAIEFETRMYCHPKVASVHFKNGGPCETFEQVLDVAREAEEQLNTLRKTLSRVHRTPIERDFAAHKIVYPKENRNGEA